ncbi:MAG: DUF4160 domain-containing protein [Microcystaceae cyanobacterium]
MSKLRTFALEGLDLFFNSHDHLPPHFHVRKPGHWEIRVFFLVSDQHRLAFNIKWPANKGPSSQEEREILKQVLKHRAALLQEWEQKVCIKENF